MASGKDKRREQRVSAGVPVEVAGLAGTARDVSAGGIYVETQAGYALGSPVDVELDLDTPWGKVMFRSRGRIVRVEHRDEKVGVAVQFTEGM
jgi:hypothetical protein